MNSGECAGVYSFYRARKRQPPRRKPASSAAFVERRQHAFFDGTGESGSFQWDAAFKCRLLHERTKLDEGEIDPYARILTRKKSNFALRDERIEMKWEDGVFIRTNMPASTGILASIQSHTCDRVFLALVDAATAEKQPVSPNVSARNYAPRMFARRTAIEREGFKIKDFEQAMRRLMKGHNPEIVAEQYGRKGDERWRISRAPDAAADIDACVSPQ
jgi:hypothetical protein